MEEMMKRQMDFYPDERGFSTTFDVLLFLVLISIAAVILLPTITGNIQVKSVIESKSQSQSSRMLTTILNGRMDEFEYTPAGEQLDAIAGPLNDSSIYVAGKKLIIGRELRHKVFSDIAAEDAAAEWVIYHNGQRIQLNILLTNYTSSLDNALKGYLDRQIGDRYSYNLTVIWRPIVNAPIGSDIRIGEQVPDNAFVETAYITMPYKTDLSRERVEIIVNESFNSTFGNISSAFEYLKKDASNRTQIESEISQEIFDSINGTIDEAVVTLMDETLAPVIDEAQDSVAGQINSLLPEGGNGLIDSINETIIATLVDEGIFVNGSLSDTLKSYIKDKAKQDTRTISEREIRSLVTELADKYVNDVMNIEAVKESITTEVFSRVQINRAELTLSIWERRS
jgi:competence protein ComGC